MYKQSYIIIDNETFLCLTGIILGMGSANERRRYIHVITPPLIGWIHTQNDPCFIHEEVGHFLPLE